MRLVMAGLDYKTADVAARGAFALTEQAREATLRAIHASGEVDGCVIVSTCNRSELYMSYLDDQPPDGVALLCRALSLEPADHRRHFVERHERQAVMHLMRVAAGMQSSVLGDDQIVTQTRNAIESARQAGTANPMLETLFRCAVTAGKKVKTSVTFPREGGSVAQEAIRRAEEALRSLADKRALVIGNGVVGRLAASALVAKGCEVTVTLRNCRSRASEAPHGCRILEYAERNAGLEGCHLAVSATSSPHRTIRLEDVAGLRDRPSLFIDLAVPCDIDPRLGGLPGVTLWNVDDLKQDDNGSGQGAQLVLAEEILDEEAGRFELWRQNRRRRLSSQRADPDFPIFINLHGAEVLVAGGGKVAARRADILLNFGARVKLVSPELAPEMERHLGRNGLSWLRRGYAAEDMDGVTLAVAATDDRETNHAIGRDARERGILVSVADRHEECSFFFPAIIQSDCLTAGLISKRNNHSLVKQAAARIREELETIDEEHSGGIPGEQAGGGAGAVDYRRNTALSS